MRYEISDSQVGDLLYFLRKYEELAEIECFMAEQRASSESSGDLRDTYECIANGKRFDLERARSLMEVFEREKNEQAH